jgi:hypothetical protein
MHSRARQKYGSSGTLTDPVPWLTSTLLEDTPTTTGVLIAP